MYENNNMTNSFNNISEIIEEEINNNQQLGFIKNNLFYMKVDANPLFYSTLKKLKLFLIVLIFPLIFSIILLPYQIYVFLLCFPVILMVLTLILHLLCYHYLILDLNNYEFHTSSYLFGKYLISALDSNYNKAQNIIKIILDTNYFNTGNNSFLCDKFIALLKNNSEEELTTIMPSIEYHEISMERGILLSKCFNIDFSVRGNLKAYDDLKETQKVGKELLPIFIIMFIIIVIALFFITSYK